jgi:hypothetical protein
MAKGRRRSKYRTMAASLSALGAGALIGAGTAEAGVAYSGPVNLTVGFGPDTIPFYSSGPFGPSSTHFSFAALSFQTQGYHFRGVGGFACGCLGFLTSSSFLKLVDKGAVWPVGGTYSSFSTAGVGVRRWVSTMISGNPYTVHTSHGGPSRDGYALFAFDSGPDTLYGWIHLSLSINNQFGSDPALGPNVTIFDWAFDDSGQTLAAGDAPEPATAIPTGLAALALGAVGLRNWRKARKAA